MEHRMRAESLGAMTRYGSDEDLAQAGNGLVAEYEAIFQARHALMPELAGVGHENSQVPDELWAKYINDLRAHAENCGAMSDRTTNVTAKFVLAVHAFDLVQEAEILERFRLSSAKARRPIVFESKMMNLDDFKRVLHRIMDSERTETRLTYCHFARKSSDRCRTVDRIPAVSERVAQ